MKLMLGLLVLIFNLAAGRLFAQAPGIKDFCATGGFGIPSADQARIARFVIENEPSLKLDRK